ncbi:helix-turn-helix transcriptional regulator [Peptostreptococcus porci]|uniref:helix-turn-helix domain-containing protein n=1 Tax=Peptostreptococcus porci TaxID=2652282 RepID=UPI002A90D4DF|nr:helix-turn-helix transcriptional regulator [Peptostreptococcus porci]MDY6231926.1 helix-turn-helix transcriptional regulator [Peptostreptococcus porci]
MSFAEKLKNLRKQHGLSQKALAEQIGKTARVISYYENEENGQMLPKMEFVQLLADFFDVSINYFTENSQVKTKEDVLIEKLINLSVDEKILWNQHNLEINSLEDSVIAEYLEDVIKSDFGVDISNSSTYTYRSDDICYILTLEQLIGYCLYIYKLEQIEQYEYKTVYKKLILNGSLANLYRIIESSKEIKVSEFIDEAIKKLEESENISF